jgi:acyl-CoA reductase-like NAD-dependent aldehyde dehydrogenase
VVLNPTVAVTVLNPATEQPIAVLAEAGIEETDAAVARARAAYPAWRTVARPIVPGCCAGSPRWSRSWHG